jgi:hypothetical protein
MRKLYSCYVYGEGGKDKKFLIVLIDHPTFKYHTKGWVFNYGNYCGHCPREILDQCYREISDLKYDLVLCFIDLDKLKHDYHQNWKQEKNKLDKKYQNIKIIWQLDNAEDEYKKVLGDRYKSKGKLNKVAKDKIQKFINSDFYKKILKEIKDKEQQLKNDESQ